MGMERNEDGMDDYLMDWDEKDRDGIDCDGMGGGMGGDRVHGCGMDGDGTDGDGTYGRENTVAEWTCGINDGGMNGD